MYMGYTPGVALIIKFFDGRVCRIIFPPTDRSLHILSVRLQQKVWQDRCLISFQLNQEARVGLAFGGFLV